jgi:hypothetical protein
VKTHRAAVIVAGMLLSALTGYLIGAFAGRPPAIVAAIIPHKREGRDALRSLKDVHAAVAGGITFTEYSRRVVDTRVAVDRYLETAPRSSETVLMKEAVDLYSVAAIAWSGRMEVVFDPRVNLCPAIKDSLQRAKQLVADGIAPRLPVEVLWACAAARLTALDGKF